MRRAAALERKRAQESREAQVMIEQFARDALSAEVTPTRLTARSYDGATRYRTQLMGWYLKRDRSVAVSVDGTFHVLSTPRSLKARFRGAHVPPADPPLELGKGARDGESIPLVDALANRLAAANDWP